MQARATPLLLVLLALPFLLLTAGCARDTGSAADVAGEEVPEAERFGGTLVLGATADIGDISPLTWNFQNALYMQQFVLFLPLLAYDAELRPVPRLARAWEVDADTTLLTFHLRDDVRWHDGVKTTAHDLLFSYRAARDPRTGYIYSGLWTHYGEAEAPDSFTFRVRMRPHAEFLDAWRAFAPVPRHVLEGVEPEALRRHPFATHAPVGNGPFRFAGRTPGQSWNFEANPDFPAELGGRPYVDRLVYRVIPEPTTLLTELETGGIDFYVAPPASQAPRIQASGAARLVSYPERAFEHIVWNHRRPPFDDARVRRALGTAIDRHKLVESVRGGHGVVAHSTIAPMLWQHDPTAGAGLRHDPDAARALLREAGFLDRDGDGVVEGADGRPFRFTLTTPHGNQERRDIGEMVQADLRRIGVAVQVQQVEFNTLLARASDAARRDFDALVIAWKPEFRVDDSDLFACARRDHPITFAGYCDPETDRLLDSLPRIADRAAARPLWHRYQHRIAEEQPFTFLFFADRLHGVSRRVQGVAPDTRGDWVGIERWWIHPRMR